MTGPETKKLLLKKGGEVAALLEALLAGKDVDLNALPPPKDPKDDPELRLRRFLEQIDWAIKAWGSDAWGRCRVCGAALDARALAERPWLQHCSAHPPV